jgi:hypothetical protein
MLQRLLGALASDGGGLDGTRHANGMSELPPGGEPLDVPPQRLGALFPMGDGLDLAEEASCVDEQVAVLVLEDGEEVLAVVQDEPPQRGVEVKGIAEDEVEGARIVGQGSVQEAFGGGRFVLAGPLRLDVHQQHPVLVEQEGQDVAVVVLDAVPCLEVDGSLRALWTGAEETAVALVAVEDERPEAVGRRLQGLLASAERVVLAEHLAHVVGLDHGGHGTQVVRTVHVSPEPATRIPPGALLSDSIEAAQACPQHQHVALEHTDRRNARLDARVADGGQPPAQLVHPVDVSKQAPEYVRSLLIFSTSCEPCGPGASPRMPRRASRAARAPCGSCAPIAAPGPRCPWG